MFACVYVPNFPAEAVMRAESETLRAQPVAVLDGIPPLVRVIAVNERARQAGVDEGMTKLQAEALPGLVLRRRSPAQEKAAHAAIVDSACAFSPRIEETTDDTVLLDVSGLDHLFGPPAAIARELTRKVSEVSVEANVAVASNIEAALHAARGFSGTTVIAPGEEARRLGTLPIEVLVTSFIEAAIARATRQARRAVEQRGQELMESFDRWGVRSFRALAALPVIAVAERLGQDGVQLQKLARGEGVRSLAPAEPPLNFVETLELEYPVENLESLAFALNRMLEQLCARLNSRSLATNELRLELALEDIADRVIEKTVERESEIEVSVAPALLHSRTLRLPVPMRDVRVFLKLLQLDLQEHPPQSPITKITLAFEPVRPQVANHGLFIPVEPQPEKLELMLARIAGIVGEGRVGSAELLDTHRPDSFHMHRFTPSKQAVRKRAKKADGSGPPHVSNTHDGQRPRADGVSMAARIFRPPLPATVQLRNDIPAHVFCTGEQAPRGDVTWVAGPWCSSGEWWKQQASQKDDAAGAATSWSREEWDVSIAGALYRLVRNLDSGDWFIEAMYD